MWSSSRDADYARAGSLELCIALQSKRLLDSRVGKCHEIGRWTGLRFPAKSEWVADVRTTTYEYAVLPSDCELMLTVLPMLNSTTSIRPCITGGLLPYHSIQNGSLSVSLLQPERSVRRYSYTPCSEPLPASFWHLRETPVRTRSTMTGNRTTSCRTFTLFSSSYDAVIVSVLSSYPECCASSCRF